MEEDICHVGEQETLAYQEIKNAILQETLPPGYQLVERDLAQQLNMSRTPIRSAFKHLEAEGFVERRSNRRLYVAYANAKDIVDMLYVREALEGMATRLAAKNRTQEQVLRLTEILRLMQGIGKEEALELYHLGEELHGIVFEACGLPELVAMAHMTKARSAMYNYRALLLCNRADESTEEHMTILRCLVAQDESGAEQAARLHVRVIRTLIEQNFSLMQAHASALTARRPADFLQ